MDNFIFELYDRDFVGLSVASAWAGEKSISDADRTASRSNQLRKLADTVSSSTWIGVAVNDTHASPDTATTPRGAVVPSRSEHAAGTIPWIVYVPWHWHTPDVIHDS